MWITKRPGSGGGQEANKMADEEARSFSHWPATDFNLRQHRFPFSVSPPARLSSMPDSDADGERIFFQSRRVRWSILAAYWAVILLALPLWWTTTSIERLSLPTSRVEGLSRKDLRFPVDVVLDSSSGVDTKGLSAKLQSLINARLSSDIRAWLDVRVHPDPILRESPATHHISPKPQQTSNTGADPYVVKFDASSQHSKVQGRNLLLAGDGCLCKSI